MENFVLCKKKYAKGLFCAKSYRPTRDLNLSICEFLQK